MNGEWTSIFACVEAIGFAHSSFGLMKPRYNYNTMRMYLVDKMAMTRPDATEAMPFINGVICDHTC